MEGKKKKVIIVAVEKGETPHRHNRVNMADMVTAVRRENPLMMGVSLLYWR